MAMARMRRRETQHCRRRRGVPSTCCTMRRDHQDRQPDMPDQLSRTGLPVRRLGSVALANDAQRRRWRSTATRRPGFQHAVRPVSTGISSRSSSTASFSRTYGWRANGHPSSRPARAFCAAGHRGCLMSYVPIDDRKARQGRLEAGEASVLPDLAGAPTALPPGTFRMVTIWAIRCPLGVAQMTKYMAVWCTTCTSPSTSTALCWARPAQVWRPALPAVRAQFDAYNQATCRLL
jgi:hypothetical protein